MSNLGYIGGGRVWDQLIVGFSLFIDFVDNVKKPVILPDVTFESKFITGNYVQFLFRRDQEILNYSMS